MSILSSFIQEGNCFTHPKTLPNENGFNRLRTFLQPFQKFRGLNVKKKTSLFTRAKLCHCPFAKLFEISGPNVLEQSAWIETASAGLFEVVGSTKLFFVLLIFSHSFHSYQSEQIKSKTRLCASISYATAHMGQIHRSLYLLN